MKCRVTMGSCAEAFYQVRFVPGNRSPNLKVTVIDSSGITAYSSSTFSNSGFDVSRCSPKSTGRWPSTRKLSRKTTKSETIIRNSNRCREQEQGSRHFNASGNVDPSGNANTTKVEPSRKDASGNNAAATLPKIVLCQPVGVATY